MRPLVGPGLAPMLPGDAAPPAPTMGWVVPAPGLTVADLPAALWRYLTGKARKP